MYFIYLMSSGKFTKVGISIKPERRIVNIQAGMIEPVSLVESFRVPNRTIAQFLEKKSHKALAPHRVLSTEWFDFPVNECRQVVSEICRDNLSEPPEITSRTPEVRVLCELLSEWRRDAGFTQETFAKEIGVNRLFVVRVENGDQIPSALVCRRWAIGCGRSPRSLWWHLEFRMARLPR